jgi:hypothetical protein
MNILPFDKQVAVIAALTEGMSIRSVERLTGIHRDTVMRLSVRVGLGRDRLHDCYFRDLNVATKRKQESRASDKKNQGD